MDASAIKEIRDLSLLANGGAIIGEDETAIALPTGVTIHDVEKYRSAPVRFRGSFVTSTVEAFAAYIQQYYEKGKNYSTVFINTEKMTATAWLDMGTLAQPSHREHSCMLTSKPTIDYEALKGINGKYQKQAEAVEWLEDWGDSWAVSGQSNSQVIRAFRNIKIKKQSDRAQVITDFSAAKSAFEQVEAVGGEDNLPSEIKFTCQPFSFGEDLWAFPLRVRVKVEKEDVLIAFQCTKLRQIADKISISFKEMIESSLKDNALTVPVYLGTFTDQKG